MVAVHENVFTPPISKGPKHSATSRSTTNSHEAPFPYPYKQPETPGELSQGQPRNT